MGAANRIADGLKLDGHGLGSDGREIVLNDKLPLLQVATDGMHATEGFQHLADRNDTALTVERGDIQNDTCEQKITILRQYRIFTIRRTAYEGQAC